MVRSNRERTENEDTSVAFSHPLVLRRLQNTHQGQITSTSRDIALKSGREIPTTLTQSDRVPRSQRWISSPPSEIGGQHSAPHVIYSGTHTIRTASRDDAADPNPHRFVQDLYSCLFPPTRNILLPFLPSVPGLLSSRFGVLRVHSPHVPLLSAVNNPLDLLENIDWTYPMATSRPVH